MKKVLIIAYYFPPHLAMGSQRAYKLAKYFSRFGWEPIVLTAKLDGKRPEGIRIIETDYMDIERLLKAKAGFDSEKGIQEQLGTSLSKNFQYASLKSKFIKLAKELIVYPDAQKGWYKFALKSAFELLSKESINAIISTSSPVTSHLIARQITRKYHVPWVADFRDPWTQNPYFNKFGIIKFFERRLEVRTIADATAIVTVTEPWLKLFKKLHRNKNIFCIANGYDKEDFPDITTKPQSKFTLTYTGRLYNGKRDPSILFEVVDSLMKSNKINKDSIEINFYGPKESWLFDEISKYKLEEVVNFYGFIPRDLVLDVQRKSQILLLLLWNNKNEEGFIPGKLYEYFGAKRPILAVGWHKSIVKKLLDETNTGKLTSNSEELKNILLEYYNEFINYGHVKCNSNQNINNYTYRTITRKYSNILNGIVLK